MQGREFVDVWHAALPVLTASCLLVACIKLWWPRHGGYQCVLLCRGSAASTLMHCTLICNDFLVGVMDHAMDKL
jgi:hypothetical protein